MKPSSIALSLLLLALTAPTAQAAGKKGYHCEVKRDGKHVDLPKSEVSSRKQCKAKGGKWVKDHGHDHDHGDGADHEHEEE